MKLRIGPCCFQKPWRTLHNFAYLLLLFAASGLPSGATSAATAPHPVPHVILAGHRFSIEIASTEAARERGLMFRTTLAADHGMLFVYPDASVRIFWMKNTLIPLDILFFDAHKRLINISADTPPCKTATCPTYASAAPARYVLELKAGTARQYGIAPGTILSLSP